MKQQDAAFWTKASQARADLDAQLQDQPAVCFVDLGYSANDDPTQQAIALRIHLCENGGEYPTAVDGIPVVLHSR